MSTETQTYFHDWAEQGEAQMLNDFGITAADVAGAEVLYASYTYESYSGSAYVIFRREGRLYEVYGSHCSCYGLEDQWTPEETSVAAIKMRPYPEIPTALIAALE